LGLTVRAGRGVPSSRKGKVQDQRGRETSGLRKKVQTGGGQEETQRSQRNQWCKIHSGGGVRLAGGSGRKAWFGEIMPIKKRWA